VIEDEHGLLQTTIFRSVYERCGEILHREGAFLLEGTVEHTDDRGFAFVVGHVRSLRCALAGVSIPTPRVTPSPGAFLRAGKRGRRAG
jgi:error-prone DNA polymerase